MLLCETLVSEKDKRRKMVATGALVGTETNKSYLQIVCFWALKEITVRMQLNVSCTRLFILLCSFSSSSIDFTNH